MRILIVGSGGREHALAEQISKSPQATAIFIAPGNGGTGDFGQNLPINPDEIEKLADFALREKIDLVVPGPELPLTLGLADALASKGINCFGPDKYASQLEGSKSFAKEVMNAAWVPTATCKEFTDFPSAASHIRDMDGEVVIKADGLAAGKGVVVAENLEQALQAAEYFLKSHGKILVEEKLRGEDVSLLCVCDGVHCLPLPSAQDHKAAYDNDEGPNTGGMGAYSPAPVLPDSHLEKMADLTVRPVLAEMAKRGHPFRGILYAGLMLTDKGPYVLEYNVRFGDPECEVILPRLKSDFVNLLMAAIKGKLSDEKPEFSDESAVGVVLACGNYPEDYPKGLPLAGLENARDDSVHIYHAGTVKNGAEIKSSGGRVLCVTALAGDLNSARDKAYKAINKIRMPLGRFRTDIAKKGIKRLAQRKKQES